MVVRYSGKLGKKPFEVFRKNKVGESLNNENKPQYAQKIVEVHG
jgi:hypothetical protein